MSGDLQQPAERAAAPARAPDEETAPLVASSPECASPAEPAATSAAASLVAAAWGSGAVCILGSAFIFSIAASLVKAAEQLDPSVSLFQIIFVRSALALALSAAIARRQGISPLFGPPPYWLFALRGTFGALAMVCFYASLIRLSLADAMTLLFLNPAFCAVLGRVLLRERCGLLTVAGVVASLTGVVLVAQPPFILHLLHGGGSSGPDAAQQPEEGWTHARLVGMVLGVAGALLASSAYITIRIIGSRVPSLSLASWFHAVSLVAGGVPMAIGVPKPAVVPRPWACACMLGVGVTSFAAQLLLNRGFQLESAARASALNFSQVVWAHLFGVLIFREPLSLLGLAGAAVIAAGVGAVAADKKQAAADVAAGAKPGGAAEGPTAQLVRLKAKSSFRLEPDDVDVPQLAAHRREAGAESV